MRVGLGRNYSPKLLMHLSVVYDMFFIHSIATNLQPKDYVFAPQSFNLQVFCILL
jgi:hypothetical protein